MSTSIAPKRSASPLEDDPPTKAARPPWQELPNTGKADRQLTDSEYQNLKSSLDTERYNVFIFEAAHICMANGSTGKSVIVSQIVSAMGKWLSLLETNYERTVVYLQQWTSMFERERTKISDLSTLFERDISQYHNFSLLPRTYIVNKGNLHRVALPAHSNHTPPTNYDQVTRAWNQDYIGSHDKLLLHNMDSSQSPESYGNVAAIVQSSGFGKSRTVDEIAKQVFTIPMNVRNPSDTSFGAYPPPDLELHEFLANSRRLVSQTHAFAFFDVYNVPPEKFGRSWWLESCPSLTHSDFATQWREYLSKDIPPQYPLIQDTNPLVDSLYFQEQQGKKFKSRGWTNSAPPVGINDAGLRKPYMDLAGIIPPRSVLDLLPKPSMNPFKNFFYIDEAHTLTALNGLPSPFIHLRSALSRLYSLAFAVFTSTHSQVAELAGRE
ncbi:hypothetical protein F5879DRAFT_1030106 [Lentinula edodes]|nr:hypothetical protein F5879DRAFT_1030106 [Lentinula edodes]